MVTKKTNIFVPSKTFLIGEYSVLEHKQAIVINTTPAFKFELTQTNKTPSNIKTSGINPHSPGGKLWIKLCKQHNIEHINLIDPHKAQGGFGQSSAIFAAGYYFEHSQTKSKNSILPTKQLHQHYQNQCSSPQSKYPPSGADLLAQLSGGIAVIDWGKACTKTYPWPFTDIGFLLLRTGNKLVTHTHLESLNKLDTHILSKLVIRCKQSLKENNQQEFCNSIYAYQRQLNKQNLTINTTNTLLIELAKIPGVITAKGCGAMGADVILIITDKKLHQQVKQKINKQKAIIADHENIHTGTISLVTEKTTV